MRNSASIFSGSGEAYCFNGNIFYVIEQVQIIFSLVKRVSNIENSRSKSDELAFLS